MGRITTKAVAVLKLMDMFTGEMAAKNDILVKVRQNNQIVWKESGVIAILDDNASDTLDVSIQSNSYCEKNMNIQLKESVSLLVVYVWLIPSLSYVFSADATYITGISAKHDTLWLANAGEAQIKLAEEYNGKDCFIKLWGVTGILDERAIAIVNDDSCEIAYIKTKADDEEQKYILKKPLTKKYHSKNSRIFLLGEVKPDTAGRFIFAFKRVAKEGGKCIIFTDDNRSAEVTLNCNDTNEVDVDRLLS